MLKYIIELIDENNFDSKATHYLNKLKYFGLLNVAASLYFLSKIWLFCFTIMLCRCWHIHIQNVILLFWANHLGNTLALSFCRCTSYLKFKIVIKKRWRKLESQFPKLPEIVIFLRENKIYLMSQVIILASKAAENLWSKTMKTKKICRNRPQTSLLKIKALFKNTWCGLYTHI